MVRPLAVLILPSLSWVIGLIELGSALYVLLLNTRHRANQHVSALLFILSLNSFGIGRLISAMNVAQATVPTLLLAVVSPMVAPMLFISTVVLLKLPWFQGRGAWIAGAIYGALFSPMLLALVDLIFGTRIWYLGPNPITYMGGILPIAQYTSEGVGTFIRFVDFNLFPLLTLIPLLYVIIRGENKKNPLTRKLAGMLLTAQLWAFVVLFGGSRLLSPEVPLLLADTIFAITYAYVGFWQMVSERRFQRWRLQNRLPLLISAVTLPIIVGGLIFVTMQASMVLGHIAQEYNVPGLDQVRRQFEVTAWIVGGVGVLLTLFLTWLTTRQALKPIAGLTETVTAITAGDLERVAPVESEDEIGLLAEAFNTMTARLRETIESLEARVAERTQELEVALSETEVLYGTSRALITFDDPAETLQRIVDMIVEILPATYVSLVTFDLAEQRVLHAIRGGSGWESVPRPNFEELQSGLAGWAIREQQAVLSPRGAPDPRESPEIQARRAKFGAGDVIVAPMGYRDRMVGTITVINRSSDPRYSQHDVTLLSAMAKQVAAAVDNARLFEQTQSALNETRALYRVAQALITLGDLEELLRAVVAAIADALPADGVLLVTFDLEAQQVLNYIGTDSSLIPERPDDFSKLWEGLSGWVLRNREPALSPKGRRDPRESEAVHQDRLRNRCGAVIVAPLQYRDKLVGTITALNYIDQPDFIARDVELMMAMANQAAIAVENARLFDRTQGALAETQALYRVSRSLVAFEDLRELLRAVVNAVAAALSASWAVIITFDVAERRVERIVQGGPYLPPPYTLDFEELWEGLTGWVIREGKPALSPKGRPDPREGELVRRHREERGGGSMIVAPLRYRGKMLGTITVMNELHKRDFNSHDVDLLTTMANQTAAAVDNARLFAQTQATLARTEALYQVARSLIALENLPTMLHIVAEQVAEALPADRVLLITLDFERREVTQFVTGGAGEKIPQVPYEELMAGLTGWVVEKKRPALSSEPVDPRESRAARRRRAETQSGAILVAPLLYRGEVLGTLTAINRPDQPDFTQRDVDLMMAMANQAAVAIENARLVRDLEAKVAARTAEIRAEQEKSEIILRSVGDAIAMVDRGMRVQYVNEAFLTLTGYTEAEALGRVLRDLVGEAVQSEKQRHALRQLLYEAEIWHGDMTLRRKDGRAYEAAVTIAPIYDAQQRLVGFVTSHRDVTQHRELERARSQFITNVSHQLRTPVTTIKLYLDLAQRLELTPRLAQCLGNADQEVAQLAHLTEDILTITSLDSGKAVTTWTPVSPEALLRSMMTRYQELSDAAEVTLELAPLPDDLPPIGGDQVRLTEMMVELVENAVTFTPAGGAVTLRAAEREREGRRWMTMSVEDTGPGLTEQELGDLFERFFRGRLAEAGDIPGTGLGLCIAEAVARAHGGEITVASAVGGGSTFTVWLLPFSSAS